MGRADRVGSNCIWHNLYLWGSLELQHFQLGFKDSKSLGPAPSHQPVKPGERCIVKAPLHLLKALPGLHLHPDPDCLGALTGILTQADPQPYT